MSLEQKEEKPDIKISSDLQPEEAKQLIIDNKLSTFKSIEGKSTLNESVWTTLYRDFYRIFIKLKYTLNPFLKNEDKKYLIYDWDLWGPLLFSLILSIILAFNSIDKSGDLILVFGVVWMGSIVLYLNANFLGSSL